MHDHSHHHSPTLGQASQRLLIATIIIIAFSFVEAIGGWWAHSLALMSDAGHMFADGFSLLFAAAAAWVASKPPSYKHSFGLGRAEVIGASISSVILLLIVLAIISEAINRLIHGGESISAPIMIVIALVGLLANILVAYILSKEASNLNVRAAILHVMSDMLGSVGAFMAGIVIYLTGWLPIDAIFSILISILVILTTIRLLKEALHVLMEGVPKHLDLKQIGMTMSQIDQVYSVHDLHVWNLSSHQIMLTAHIELKDSNDWPKCLESLKSLLKAEFSIEHVTLQPEIIKKTLYQLGENTK